MSNFNTIFKRKEFKEIRGSNFKGIVVLTLILLVTFLALGHVFGGLEELNQRMLNPYTNWVSIRKEGLDRKIQNKFLSDFNEDATLKEEYKIKNIGFYNRDFMEILNSSLDESRSFNYRTLDFTDADPLFNAIRSPSNVVVLNHNIAAGEEDCSLIITQEALGRLDYSSIGSEVLRLPILFTDQTESNRDYVLFLEINCVVEELPDEVDIAISNNLSTLLNKDANFLNKDDSKISVITSEKIEFNLEGINKKIVSRDKETIESYNAQFHVDHFYLSVPRDSLINKMDGFISSYPYVEIDCFKSNQNADQFYYSINFLDTEMIRAFKAKAKKDYNIEIPLAAVESKDNFYLMSRLANLFITLLIIFSLSSILLFLYNIISSHLKKIKGNLGTLKAFGLDNGRVRRLYINIFSKYFLLSSFVAGIMALIYHFMLKFFLPNSNFNLFDLRIVLIWLAILICLLLFFRVIIKRILFKSPGDLIYNR